MLRYRRGQSWPKPLGRNIGKLVTTLDHVVCRHASKLRRWAGLDWKSLVMLLLTVRIATHTSGPVARVPVKFSQSWLAGIVRKVHLFWPQCIQHLRTSSVSCLAEGWPLGIWRIVLNCSYMLSWMHSWAVHRAAWSLSKAMKVESLGTKTPEKNYERPIAISIGGTNWHRSAVGENKTKFRRLLGGRGFICEKRDRSFEFKTQNNLGNNLLRKLVKGVCISTDVSIHMTSLYVYGPGAQPALHFGGGAIFTKFHSMPSSCLFNRGTIFSQTVTDKVLFAVFMIMRTFQFYHDSDRTIRTE